MTDPTDPIESLRESFEAMEPNGVSRARWAERVGHAMARRGENARGALRWRLFGWSALAAAAMLAVVVVHQGMETADTVHDNRFVRSVGAPASHEEARHAHVSKDGDALAMAEILMSDHSVRQLLSWKLPSPAEFDLGVGRMLDDLAGAILRPITRLSAQIEAGV